MGAHLRFLGFGAQVVLAKLSERGAWQSTEPGHGATDSGVSRQLRLWCCIDNIFGCHLDGKLRKV